MLTRYPRAANSAAQAPPINPAPTQATASVTGSAVEPCASSIWFVIECHLYFIICRLTNHVIDSSFPSASRPGSGHRRSGETKHMATAEKTRSEEHTSELQSLMRISYAVFCLQKKNKI